MKQKELAAALKCIVILCLLAGIGLCGILLPMYGATIWNMRGCSGPALRDCGRFACRC